MKTTWENGDPFFDRGRKGKEEAPFVSTLVQSKLAIREVLKGNLKGIKELRDDREKVHSLLVERSVAEDMSALDYALKANDIKAARLLAAPDEEGDKPRVEQPTCRYNAQFYTKVEFAQYCFFPFFQNSCC